MAINSIFQKGGRSGFLLILSISSAIIASWFYITKPFERTEIARDPTSYASDDWVVWERWDSSLQPVDDAVWWGSDKALFDSLKALNISATLHKFSDVSGNVVWHSSTPVLDLPANFEVKYWRGGWLIGEKLILNKWIDFPGEMSKRWKTGGLKYYKLSHSSDSKWVSISSDGKGIKRCVVWSEKNSFRTTYPIAKSWWTLENFGAYNWLMGNSEVWPNNMYDSSLNEKVIDELEGNWDGNTAIWNWNGGEPGERAMAWGILSFSPDMYEIFHNYSLLGFFRVDADAVVWGSSEDVLARIKRGKKSDGEDNFQNTPIWDGIWELKGKRFVAHTFEGRTIWVDASEEGVEPDSQEVISNSFPVRSIMSEAKFLGVSRNHRINSDMDIMWYDEKSTVKAIDAQGNVIWKRGLKNAPIGNSYEVDIYRNNKYQTAFATSNSVLLVDVKGNDVKGFPFLPGQEVTGFAVLDYDHNKKFRFLVATSDGNLTNLKDEARRTSGWNFKPLTNGKYVVHLSHLRVGRRDYLYGGCNDGSVLLLKRTGEIRGSTPVRVYPGSAPAFRLSGSIGKTTVLFVDEEGWLRELTLSEAKDVGMSGITKADRVSMTDLDGDGIKEVVTWFNGVRSVWNSRNELVSSP